MNTLKKIKNWHELARKEPNQNDFNVQLGCHFDENGKN